VADSAANVKRPIGVFDSGVGGLSVLKALCAELPHEDFVYLADSGFAPMANVMKLLSWRVHAPSHAIC